MDSMEQCGHSLGEYWVLKWSLLGITVFFSTDFPWVSTDCIGFYEILPGYRRKLTIGGRGVVFFLMVSFASPVEKPNTLKLREAKEQKKKPEKRKNDRKKKGKENPERWRGE